MMGGVAHCVTRGCGHGPVYGERSMTACITGHSRDEQIWPVFLWWQFCDGLNGWSRR